MKSAKISSKRVPVLVENETYCRFQAFCEQTGITVTHSVNEALNDWMDSVGALRLKAFKKPGREILLEAASKHSKCKHKSVTKLANAKETE